MLLAAIRGRQNRWEETYALLKTAHERVKDRDITLEAQALSSLGDAAQKINHPRANAYHQQALKIFRELNLPCTTSLAQRLMEQP